jgi:hypothetical protein
VIPYGHHFYVQPAPLDQGLEAPAHDIDHQVPGILEHQLGHGREGADNVADGAIPGDHHKFLLLNCGNTQEFVMLLPDKSGSAFLRKTK